MHAEELTHQKMSTPVGILLSVAMVFAVVFCVFWVSFLQWLTGQYWIQIILYVLVIIAVFFIVKKMLTNYIYLIEKDRITYGRKIGKREKELLMVPLRDVQSFGPYAQMEATLQGKKRFKFTFRKKQDWYVINCTGCAIIMSPTPEYIQCLSKATNKREKQDA